MGAATIISISKKTNEVNRPELIYRIIIDILGLCLIIYVAPKLSMELIWIYVFWTVFSTATELKPVTISYGDQLTVSFAVHISSLFLFGLPTAILISTISNIIVDATGKRGLNKLLFNFSQYAISIYAAYIGYHYLLPNNIEHLNLVNHINLREYFPAMFLSCIIYVIVNYTLVSTVVSLHNKTKLLRELTRDIKLELLHFASLVPVSLLIVILYITEPLSILIVILPLAMAHYSFENYIVLRTETKKTIEALADIIDKRDSYTSEHSLRVANYCREIAEQLNLQPSVVETLDTAARVHDLGKISVPDSILLKSGCLNPTEREIILGHSQVGYDILNNLRFYKSGAQLVRCHHETYDGNGYPQGLKAHNIPLGARILAVADAFDAMTSDRPYRKAMTREEAINELDRCSGTQFDPHIVKAFIRYLTDENN
ncbi:HD-GYP domain-containing protein [Pelotomaculum propionicicum]|uniref:Cyclic di-GMP phosphodiesterase response regulator RpfG n=1 Tax=Pelotomaculum propionicicum TaxID=258475 RepID=A0A4Y7RJU0_9FIRM|nr:HD domain-containing phosphohydrolase [Pelotomaculum propionicicum]TEB09010.1 Cyclic di-GMP phosphodiesterase response regulator RpfG [Pelotomaculum propionicicum]